MFIDDIIIGQKMPGYIPDTFCQGPELQQILNRNIKWDTTHGFTYIPHYYNNINRSSLQINTRHAISSRFTGCWMAAWEEVDGVVYAGHIHKDADYKKDCGQLFIDNVYNKARRSFVFRPSDIKVIETINDYSIYGIILFDGENDPFDHLTAYGVYKDYYGNVDTVIRLYEGPFKGHVVIIDNEK